MNTPTARSQPSGYVSEESKKTFTTVAGVLGGLFFVLQFVLPMAAMFTLMPGMMASMDFASFDLEGAASLDGRIYLIESTRVLQGERAESASARLVALGREEIEPITSLAAWEPHLLSDGRRLWLISSDRVASFEDGHLTPHEILTPLGDISAPFLLEGVPAVVETRPEGANLLTWTDAGWGLLRPVTEEEQTACCRQFLADGEGVTELRAQGSTLYARRLGSDGWDVVASDPRRWDAFLRGSTPAVALLGETGDLRVLELRGGTWRETLRATGGPRFVSGFTALGSEDGEHITVLSAGFPGSVTRRTWAGPELVAEQRFGRASPFPEQVMTMMWLPHLGGPVMSLLLAVILAWLMRVHRVAGYVHEGREVQHASLTRRAVSQLVDAAILFTPGVFLFARFFEMITDPELMFGSEWGPFRFFGYLAAGMAWAFFLFVVFSVTEGLWGATPGKWLTGIRVVGTDLRPCGIGRALIRNLLKLVDGFFNFLIGILMVAYTEDWQRLGDLAARTIVIHPAPRPPK